MSLTNFFRVNLPYGIQRNSNDEWSAFNREYQPIGVNDVSFSSYDHALPIRTKYKGITEKFLKDLVDDDSMIQRDSEGEVTRVFLYNDGTNPTNQEIDKKHLWESYFDKLKKLSKLKRIGGY